MAILTYILGRSGTGKSYSLRNFDPEELLVINVQGKILPFKGSGRIETINSDNSADIVKYLETGAKHYKTIVVDDFQYIMANEFMRRSAERGYDKFTEIARHAWDIADTVRNLPKDVIVYILCHTDTDADGIEKLKTIGKLLDEKIVLEGMSTIVLKTAVSDGQYMFLTQNNGRDTVKSPAGMFDSYAIENDLKYVDDKIRQYYEIGDFKKNLNDAEHELPEIQKEGEKKKRGRKTKEEVVKEASAEETAEEKPKRKRSERIRETLEANGEAIANNIPDVPEDVEEVPFEEVSDPVVEELPKRKRRAPVETPEEHINAPVETPEEPAEEQAAPIRRRRRRGTTA